MKCVNKKISLVLSFLIFTSCVSPSFLHAGFLDNIQKLFKKDATQANNTQQQPNANGQQEGNAVEPGFFSTGFGRFLKWSPVLLLAPVIAYFAKSGGAGSSAASGIGNLPTSASSSFAGGAANAGQAVGQGLNNATNAATSFATNAARIGAAQNVVRAVLRPAQGGILSFASKKFLGSALGVIGVGLGLFVAWKLFLKNMLREAGTIVEETASGATRSAAMGLGRENDPELEQSLARTRTRLNGIVSGAVNTVVTTATSDENRQRLNNTVSGVIENATSDANRQRLNNAVSGFIENATSNANKDRITGMLNGVVNDAIDNISSEDNKNKFTAAASDLIDGVVTDANKQKLTGALNDAVTTAVDTATSEVNTKKMTKALSTAVDESLDSLSSEENNKKLKKAFAPIVEELYEAPVVRQIRTVKDGVMWLPKKVGNGVVLGCRKLFGSGSKEREKQVQDALPVAIPLSGMPAGFPGMQKLGKKDAVAGEQDEVEIKEINSQDTLVSNKKESEFPVDVNAKLKRKRFGQASVSAKALTGRQNERVKKRTSRRVENMDLSADDSESTDQEKKQTSEQPGRMRRFANWIASGMPANDEQDESKYESEMDRMLSRF